MKISCKLIQKALNTYIFKSLLISTELSSDLGCFMDMFRMQLRGLTSRNIWSTESNSRNKHPKLFIKEVKKKKPDTRSGRKVSGVNGALET